MQINAGWAYSDSGASRFVPPTAIDDSATMNEDDTLTLDVISNDVDIDSFPLFLESVGVSADAFITTSGMSDVFIAPNPDFFGTVVFTYTVTDGDFSDEGTVTVTVSAINDLPFVFDDTYFMIEDQPLTVTPTVGVLGNDFDIDDPIISAVLQTPPVEGDLVLNVDGSFVYTPTLNQLGFVTFTYSAEDVPSSLFVSPIATATIFIDEDTDGDLIINFIDVDDDNDGILDTVEGEPLRDSDGDFIPDYLDIDSDNDGLPDIVEAQTTADFQLPVFEDGNANGLDSRWDPAEGGTPPPLPNFDSDNDAIPDYLDADSDNDGLPDVAENGIGDLLMDFDSDFDGLDDAFEGINILDDNLPYDEIIVPSIDIPDSDGDVFSGGDVDFRDVAPTLYFLPLMSAP